MEPVELSFLGVELWEDECQLPQEVAFLGVCGLAALALHLPLILGVFDVDFAAERKAWKKELRRTMCELVDEQLTKRTHVAEYY